MLFQIDYVWLKFELFMRIFFQDDPTAHYVPLRNQNPIGKKLIDAYNVEIV